MIVTRFAPSPTGYLHLGHAYAAIFAHDRARENGGRFLLRLEDIDLTRVRPEFADAIVEDIRWLKLEFDAPVLSQSTRFDAYRAALARLDSQDLLYPCFCTRSDIAREIARAVEAPHGPNGPLYPGTCRVLTAHERESKMSADIAYALRLDTQATARRIGPISFLEEGAGPNGERGHVPVDPLLFGDVVLARKDIPASYHLAVVVDDAFQGVSLVTRGNDLFAATHIQRVLQALLGYDATVYAHHALILDENGRKFSKRDRSVTLKALREAGETPAGVRARLDFPSR
jgi:glutamyl-Q tRNA(Asp) synthetase